MEPRPWPGRPSISWHTASSKEPCSWLPASCCNPVAPWTRSSSGGRAELTLHGGGLRPRGGGTCGYAPVRDGTREVADRGVGQQAGREWITIVLIVTSVLTAGAVLRVAGRVFLGWGPRPAHDSGGVQGEDDRENRQGDGRIPWVMSGPIVVLVLVALISGLPSPLADAATSAARRFTDTEAYRAPCSTLARATWVPSDPSPRDSTGLRAASTRPHVLWRSLSRHCLRTDSPLPGERVFRDQSIPHDGAAQLAQRQGRRLCDMVDDRSRHVRNRPGDTHLCSLDLIPIVEDLGPFSRAHKTDKL